MPLHVMFGEAHDFVAFALAHWRPETDPQAGTETRPGLESAGKKLTLSTFAEIEDLTGVGRRLQSEYLLAVDGPTVEARMARGTFIVSETRSVLECYFDDGVEDEKDAQLAAVSAAHKDDPDSADALAAHLTDLIALARPHRAEIDGLGGFDAKLLDEGEALARVALSAYERRRRQARREKVAGMKSSEPGSTDGK